MGYCGGHLAGWQSLPAIGRRRLQARQGGLWPACGLARGPAERNSVSGIVCHWIDAYVLTPCLKFSPRPPINIHLQQPQSSPSTSLNPDRATFARSSTFVGPLDKSTLRCYRASSRLLRVLLLAWPNPPPPPPAVLLHPGKSISHAHRGLPSRIPNLDAQHSVRPRATTALRVSTRLRAFAAVLPRCHAARLPCLGAAQSLPAQMYFYGRICAIPSHFGPMSRTVRSSHSNTITSNSKPPSCHLYCSTT